MCVGERQRQVKQNETDLQSVLTRSSVSVLNKNENAVQNDNHC